MEALPTTTFQKSLQFEEPMWLILIIIIPALILLLNLILKNKKHAVALPTVKLLSTYKFSWSTQSYLIIPTLRIIGLCLLCVALARPQSSIQTVTQSYKSLNMMIVLDLSNSMRAYDIQPTRLKAAKRIIADFVRQRSTDRIGLVGFSGKSMTLIPLTKDHHALLETIDQLNTGVIKIDGTAIGNALLTAANRLIQSQPDNASHQPGIIILATDGINTQGQSPDTAAKVLAEKGIKLYAIGLGGEKPVLRYKRDWDGTMVPKRNVYGELQYWSRPDHDTLKNIANQTNGQFFNAANKEQFESVMGDIDRLEKPAAKLERHRQSQALFLWPLIMAVLVLLSERLLSRLRYFNFT